MKNWLSISQLSQLNFPLRQAEILLGYPSWLVSEDGAGPSYEVIKTSI